MKSADLIDNHAVDFTLVHVMFRWFVPRAHLGTWDSGPVLVDDGGGVSSSKKKPV